MSLFSLQALVMQTQASGRMRMTIRSFFLGLLATAVLSSGLVTAPVRANGFGGGVNQGSAQSANSVECGNDCECKSAKQDSVKKGSAADPVWLYDGGLHLSYTDLVVGRNFPIQITRNYDSRSEYDSAIGYGWAYSFDKRLFEYPDGSIVVRSGCGAKSRFVYSGGAYVAPQGGLQGTLTALGNGTYELRYVGGNLSRFDADGRLSSIVGASGAKLELLYDSRGRLPLIGTSPRALDPDTPMVVAYQPRVTRIQERGADGTLTGYYVDFQYNDTTGRVTSVTASDGRVVNYGFDVSGSATRGNLVSVSGLTDYSQTFAYTVDANNPDQHNVTSITDGTGATSVVNQYDSLDRVKNQTEGSQIWGFAYPTAGTTTVTQTVKNSSGVTIQTRTSTYLFDAGGYLTKITDPQGNETRYTFDGNRDITRTELWEKQGSNLVLLKAVDNTYNGLGQTLTETVTLDSVGGQAAEVITTTWTYDNGWVASVQTVSSKYAQIFREEYVFNRDAQNRPVSIASVKRRKDDGTFATTSFTYCTAAEAAAANSTCPDTVLVKQVDGPRADVSDIATIAYYGTTDTSGCGGTGNCWHRGDRKTITNALGQSITFLRYDAAGRAVKVQDANGVISEFLFHPRGWLNQQIVRGSNDTVTTDDEITTFDHDARGNLTKVTSPDGHFATLTYDGRDQLTRIDDQLQGWINYKYDSAGNIELREWRQGTGASTLKRSQALTVDVLDRVVQAAGGTAGNTASLTYDAAGRQTKVTDPNSVQATQTYDDLDRLIATVSDSGSGGLMVTTGMAYDAVGNLRSVVDPKGLTTSYVYDALGRMTQQASPDSGTTNYTYDDAGNLKTKTDARSITQTTTYDALNRPLTVTYPTTAENVTYTYDTVNAVCTTGETFALGQLTKMTDQSGTTEYCYDRFGNLTRKVQTTGGVAHVVRYTYTLANQPASLTYPDGTLVDYVRDANSQVKEVGVTVAGGTRQVLVGNATYLPAGPASSWQFGTTRTLTRTYDQDYRATSVQDPGAGGLDIGYVYDNASYLKQITTQSTAAIRAKFDYDALGRLLDRKNAADVIQESYTYDGTGNRLSNTVGGTTTTNTYPTTNHRLTQVGAVARTYDNAGNLTAIGGTTREYAYNDANRMSLAKAGGVLQATYLYNGMGEQVQRQTGVTTRFVYDEGGSLLGQYDSTGAVVQEYVYLGGVPIGTILSTSQGTGNSRLKWVQTDALGTPRAIIDPTRSLAIWRWDENSETFGNGSPNTDPDADGTNLVFDLRFPGQRYDAASGLYYNYYRDYDPATGRYVQSDPIGLGGGISTYGYVGGMPTGAIDPLGLAHGYFDWGDVFFGGQVAILDALNIDPTLPQGFVDFTFGFLDNASFGLSKLTRKLTGQENSVNECNGYYAAGSWAAVAFDLLTGGEFVKAGLKGLKGARSIAGSIGKRDFIGAVKSTIKSCANSFDENTLVRTDEGLKRISEVDVGDKVLARNEQTGEERYDEVVGKMVEWHDTTLTVQIWKEDGSEEIITTDEHPFYVVGKGFIPANKLAIGDVIKLAGNRLSVVGNITRNFNGQFAYNLSVANDHTYFVGRSGAWVHNALCGWGNIGSHSQVSIDTVLNSGIKWMGSGYKELYPGVWRSADGLRQFRMTTADLLGSHGSMGSHVHFEALDNFGNVIENLHIPIP